MQESGLTFLVYEMKSPRNVDQFEEEVTVASRTWYGANDAYCCLALGATSLTFFVVTPW